MIGKFDFGNEISKNYVHDIIKTTGIGVMGCGFGYDPLRVVYDLPEIDLVAIIKADSYDEEYKKVDKYLVDVPDLILIGSDGNLKNMVGHFKERKIEIKEYNSNKRNEEALERRFGKSN